MAKNEQNEQSQQKLSFDELFPYMGGAGVFQFTLFVIIGCVGVCSVEIIYSNFFGASMDHWCSVQELNNLPYNIQKMVSIPSDTKDKASGESLDKCNMFNFNYSLYSTDDFLNWNRSARLAELEESGRRAVVNCQQGWIYDRSTFTKTIVSEYNLVCGQEFKVSLASTIYVAGMMFGGLAIGAIADSIGRKPALLMSVLIKTAGGVFSALAPEYITMMVARFITGFGSSGFYLCAFVLMMEVSSPRGRSVLGIGHMIVFSIGYMIAPGVAYAIRDFRKLLIVMATPNLVGILYAWFVPESPRWLLATGKVDKAREVIEYIAAVNHKHLPEWLDIRQVQAVDDDVKDLPKRNVFDLFKNPSMRKWTLIVYLHWFTDSLVYYALSLNSGSLAGSVFLNTFLLGLVEVPANIICALALEWRYLGRRGTACGSLLLAGGASLLSIPLAVTGAVPALATALAMIGKAGGTMGFTSIYIYSSEIFPTEVRNIGMGTSSMSARISGMAAPFVGKEMGKAWKGLPFLIYGTFGVLTGGLTLLLPETLNRPLTQTIEEAANMKNIMKRRRTAIFPMDEEERAGVRNNQQ